MKPLAEHIKENKFWFFVMWPLSIITTLVGITKNISAFTFLGIEIAFLSTLLSIFSDGAIKKIILISSVITFFISLFSQSWNMFLLSIVGIISYFLHPA